MILKFRAWDKENRIMYQPCSMVSNWDSKTMSYLPETPICNYMQYTGLKDKNGKDIYEGDLFGKFGGDKERPGEYEIHGQIKFDTDFAMFVIELTNGGWMELFDYMNNRQNQREIIGNIYENPELLK